MSNLFPLFPDSFEIREKKKRIRFEMKLLKEGISIEEKNKSAEIVFKKIEQLSEFIAAKTIMVYWAMPDELPTQAFINKWKNKKLIILPSVKDRKLELKRYTSEAEMVQRALGIWEPYLTENFVGKIDLIIVPGLAFDLKKNRLGRGKGYYDKFLRHLKAIKIGVGFDIQLIYSVPVNNNDKHLDKIILPSKTIE